MHYFLRNVGNTSFDGTASYPRRSQSTLKNLRIPYKTRYFTTAQTNIGFLKSYSALCFLQSVLGKNVQEDAYYVLKKEVHSDRQVLFTLWFLHARMSNGPLRCRQGQYSCTVNPTPAAEQRIICIKRVTKSSLTYCGSFSVWATNEWSKDKADVRVGRFVLSSRKQT
jgi:hypothetical protein